VWGAKAKDLRVLEALLHCQPCPLLTHAQAGPRRVWHAANASASAEVRMAALVWGAIPLCPSEQSTAALSASLGEQERFLGEHP